MAEIIDPIEALNETVENVTETQSANIKIPASPEGAAVAYATLIALALAPIFLGAIRSVKHQKQQKASGEKPDVMTSRDALQFPFIASIALFGFYVAFKMFSKDYIDLLLGAYFFILGILALSHLLSPVVGSLIPTSLPNIPFHILFTQGEGNKKVDLIDYKFTSHDIYCLIFSTVIGVWYIMKKHWIANNLFGFAFAVNGVELLHLNNIVTGLILLCGLFVYDIFWVFGTDVMVTVARNFDAPIKLIFPQDIITNGLNASNFAMLGLGDIVIPGIFIALLLRFDHSLKRKTKLYFYSTFTAYFLGLVSTILVMHWFKHAQPALLYLVPFCLATPLMVALIKGDIKTLFSYEDFPEPKKIKDEKNVEKVKESKKKEVKKTK